MPNTLISPNMSLPVPVVGVDPGPDYASNLDACLTLIDQHDHSPGYGVQINPTGMNINADLPINSHNLTLVRSVRFASQVAPISLVTDLSCLYSVTQTGSNGDLWFNDASGNQIQLTKSGAVLATISALVSGLNQASFVANQLVVLSNSSNGTPANIKGASLLLGNNSSSTNYLTLQPPNVMGASYSVTLPAPNALSQTAVLTYDTSNNILATTSLASIANGINPSGAMIAYGGTSAPTGYLMCDGTSYLISTYPVLAAALFDSGTSKYAYGSADGTHFNVPDFRGYFLRGTDNGAGRDPDASSRLASITGANSGVNVGSIQSFANQDHTHTAGNFGNTNPGSFIAHADTSGGGAGTVTTSSASGQVTTEARPLNIYVNYIIKT